MNEPKSHIDPEKQHQQLLNVSIVRYEQDFETIASLVRTISSSAVVKSIYLIDNSKYYNEQFETLPVHYIKTQKNIGYGRAHNIALRKTLEEDVPYHLVVNPDVELNANHLSNIVLYLMENPSVGALMPKIFYPDGNLQYLCKLLPTPFDLINKRFFPKKWFKRRSDLFLLKHFDYQTTLNIPYLSGCFMVLSMTAIKKSGFFDERFFLYPEDIDLSRRIHEHFQTCFFPEVSIIHRHEQGSYKNFRLLMIHIVNMIRYFNKWGWFFDKQRKKFNQETLQQINQLEHQK
ncbi:MAG: glycosyltransferase [Microbacter sp.]